MLGLCINPAETAQGIGTTLSVNCLRCPEGGRFSSHSWQNSRCALLARRAETVFTCMHALCRSAVAQALPQLRHLDKQPLDDERAFLRCKQGPAAQHIAELQLQAYQPQRETLHPGHLLAAPLVAEGADSFCEQPHRWPTPVAYLQGVTPGVQDMTYMHCMQLPPNLPRAPRLPGALGEDEVQTLADRLAQRLAQSRAALPDEASTDSAKQEQRWASMEARLAALSEGKLPVPDQTHASQARRQTCGHAQEHHLSDDFGAANARRDSAPQKQQLPKHGSRCSGSQIASAPVQQLQVGSHHTSCEVSLHLTNPI